MIEEIKTITLEDKNYPEILKKIENPPKTLYYRGELKSKEDCFAVVGTRRASVYGKEVTFEIVGDLVQAGLTIVSGLAPGIDTFTHQAVIERILQLSPHQWKEKGRTIAVLGTGLDKKSIYPKSNLKLAEKILETGGCLISEYPAGTPGSKFTFPQRNRIISGLSLGVLVVEAKQKSGALITAQYALSQKRKVFAVPGSIYSLNSKGCHYLIKQGAKLVESADDILKEINLPSEKSFFRKKEVKGENETEDLILNALREKALEVDEIIKKTKLPTATVASTLAVLEIKGKIRNLGGNNFTVAR